MVGEVGTTGFEPATPCTPCKCATGLRYVPRKRERETERERVYSALFPFLFLFYWAANLRKNHYPADSFILITSMRKIILDLAVTLDGFIEGPNGEIDWCIIDDASGSDDFLGDLLAETDTIFYGRISYDMWGNWQPDENADPAMKKAYHAIRSKKKYVFSSTKTSDQHAVVIGSEIKERVEQILKEPGKSIWLYGGGKLITTFMNLGLIDEFRLAVHPVILGEGKPLFNEIRNRVNLKLLSVKSSSSGVTVLIYERIK